MASAGKGLPFIGKMNEFLDRVLHPTVQKAGNSRAALDVISRGYYLLDINAYVAEAGSTDNTIVLTAHPFKTGDSVRLYITANPIIEQEITIDEIVDANTVKLAGYLSDTLTVGDQFYVRRPTIELLAEDGTRLSSLSYIRDGIAVPVERDTVVPTNSTALPVEIMGANGMVLNVTTGDLNIQSFHQDRIVNAVNVPGDSMKIGDGTTLAGVTLTNELKTSDADALVELADINTELNTQTTALGDINSELDTHTTALGDINTELNTQTVSLGSIDTKLSSQATAAKQDLLLTAVQAQATLLQTQPVSIASMPSTPITNANLDVTLSTRASEATLAASNLLIGAVTETAPASDTDSSGLNGRLQRIAQRLTSLISILPSSLGIKAASGSLSVAPASDAIFNTKPKAVTGTYAENLALTTVQTFTAPANAIGAIIQADDANAANFRAKQGAAATSTSGIQFQAGRSEEFKSGSDISVCSEGVSVKVYVQWFIQS